MDVSFLNNIDKKFLSQAADPESRKKEITRLAGQRRINFLAALALSLMFVAVSLFFLYMAWASRRPLSDRDFFNFLFVLVATLIMIVIQLLGFLGAQNQLRLLLLAGQIDERKAHAEH